MANAIPRRAYITIAEPRSPSGTAIVVGYQHPVTGVWYHFDMNARHEVAPLAIGADCSVAKAKSRR